ncbi:MAG: 16S rRNA (guanine(966)-N(2))-methyltransferase RsmD [Christensenellales bacterium]|jgi:16S rRNA (guanine966-N2)-methyltransferase
MRIISGTARGRRIDTPEGRNTRPTLDRVKEALFGSIQFDIPHSRVLDLFAGSGSLGLEALSRGAKQAVFNDSAAECVRIIQNNVEKLGFVDRSVIMQRDYASCLSFLAGKRPFDFIFIDPPYQKDLAKNAVEQIFALGLLAKGGRIVVERDAKVDSAYCGTLLSVRKYGDTELVFLTNPESE